VSRVARIKFDSRDDERLLNPKYDLQNKNLFEVYLKDEFLPIYTHSSYTQMFKENSLAMERTPDRRKSASRANGSVMRDSAGRNSNNSPSKSSTGGKGRVLEVPKKVGGDMKESPSKGSKIVMKYINNYADVGP